MTAPCGDLRGSHVLLVDDDPAILRGLDVAFQRVGCRVFTARDGNEALRVMAVAIPDLLVTDIIMPHREGLDTIMVARGLAPQLSIIAISGGGRIDAGEFLSLALALGADATLSKPFRPSQLLRIAEGLLAGKVAA